MTDLDRFDPFAWLDQIMVIVPARVRRTEKSRLPPWASDLRRFAHAAAHAGAAGLFATAHIASTVPLRSSPTAVEEAAGRARDPDAADAAYWKRVDAYLASTPPTPELLGEDPEMPDYDS